MIDLTRMRMPQGIKYFWLLIVLAAPMAGSPCLAGNWQGYLQQGLNYAGRAASAAQRARAARSSAGGSDASSQPSTPAETSVHAEVRPQERATPAPAPSPSPAPVTPPPPTYTESSGGSNLHDKWFGHNRRASYSGSNANSEPESTARSYQSGQPARDIVPASLRESRLSPAHNLHAKLKKPVVAQTSPAGPTTDANPEHNILRQANNDKPEHKDNAPPANNAVVDTQFIGPLLDKMLERLKG